MKSMFAEWRSRATKRIRMTRWLLLLLVSLGSTLTICAADTNTSAFEQANKLYEQGKYGDAVAAYEKMIATEQASAAIFFNLGNAFFKDNQLGKAIYNYRRAEWLSPRDPDILANLQFARKVASGATPEDVNYWEQFIGKLNLNEWTLLTMAIWWVWLGLLAAVLWRPEWRKASRIYRRWSVTVAVVLTFFTWSAAGDRLRGSPAVVIGKEAVVRYGPLAESRSFYSLHDGAELNVLDRKDEWLQVTDSAQRIGWLKAEQVILLKNTPAMKTAVGAKSSS